MPEFNESKSPEQIEEEIVSEGLRLKKEDPEGWLGYINNFWAKVLPLESESFGGLPRQKSVDIGSWDRKLRDIIPKERWVQYSDLRLDQTGKEFYDSIDKVVEEFDSTGEIKILIEKLSNVRSYQDRVKIQSELEEKILPVFARLITMGYCWGELGG